MKNVKKIEKKSSTEANEGIISSTVENNFYKSSIKITTNQIRLGIYRLNPFVKDN